MIAMQCHTCIPKEPRYAYVGYNLLLKSSTLDCSPSNLVSRLATSFSSPSAAASGFAST